MYVDHNFLKHDAQSFLALFIQLYYFQFDDTISSRKHDIDRNIDIFNEEAKIVIDGLIEREIEFNNPAKI